MQRIAETCSYVYLHLCARLQPLVLLARRTIEFAFSRHLVRMSRLPVHNCIKSAGAEEMTALKTVAAKERSWRRGQRRRRRRATCSGCGSGCGARACRRSHGDRARRCGLAGARRDPQTDRVSRWMQRAISLSEEGYQGERWARERCVSSAYSVGSVDDRRHIELHCKITSIVARIDTGCSRRLRETGRILDSSCSRCCLRARNARHREDQA